MNPTQQARASQRAPTSLRKGRAPAPFGETLDVRDEDEEEEVEDDLGLPDELEVEAEAEVEPAEPQTTRETRRQRQASPEVIASPPLPRSFRQDSRAGRAAGRGKQKATDIPAVEFIGEFQFPIRFLCVANAYGFEQTQMLPMAHELEQGPAKLLNL